MSFDFENIKNLNFNSNSNSNSNKEILYLNNLSNYLSATSI